MVNEGLIFEMLKGIISYTNKPIKKSRKNVMINKEGNMLKVLINLKKSKEKEISGSGRNIVIASTRGNISFDHNGKEYFIGLNVYTKNPALEGNNNESI